MILVRTDHPFLKMVRHIHHTPTTGNTEFNSLHPLPQHHRGFLLVVQTFQMRGLAFEPTMSTLPTA
jgi:hypothetical protein